MTDTTKNPELRFPEFIGNADYDWQVKRLGDICVKIGRTVGFKNVDSYSISAGIGFVSHMDKWGKDNAGKQKEKYLHIKKGEFVYNKGNSKQYPYGCTYLLTHAKEIAVPNVFIAFSADTDVVNLKFLEYFFILGKHNQYLRKYITSSARSDGLVNLNKSDFFKIILHVPHLDEQQKIAGFLSSIDRRLVLLQAKYDRLMDYKRGIMQQIFTQKIRFKKTNGTDYPKWQQNRLGVICKFFSGGTPLSKNTEYYNGNIPFIGSGEIKNLITEKKINEMAMRESSAKMVEVGDLLYALYGATSGEVAISKIKGAINQAILCIRSNQINIAYLYYQLLHSKERILQKYLQGGQGNLSATIVKQLQVDFPHPDEQKHIADFLSAIDYKIDTLNTQIIQTKQYKKSLMQRMFV